MLGRTEGGGMVTRDDGNELAGGLIGGASPEPTLAYRALRRVYGRDAAVVKALAAPFDPRNLL